MAADNIPAFPCEQHECLDGSWNQTFEPGMSLRDYFAGQALTAFGEPYGGRSDDSHARRNYLYGEHAARVFAFADAMLAERAKGSDK